MFRRTIGAKVVDLFNTILKGSGICGTVIKGFQHIFECNEVNKYYRDLSTHLEVHRITGIKTLIGDPYLWHNVKERPKQLTQFAISSFIIAELLNWQRTKFKIVAYLSHLLISNIAKLYSLGDEIKKLIIM